MLSLDNALDPPAHRDTNRLTEIWPHGSEAAEQSPLLRQGLLLARVSIKSSLRNSADPEPYFL